MKVVVLVETLAKQWKSEEIREITLSQERIIKKQILIDLVTGQWALYNLSLGAFSPCKPYIERSIGSCEICKRFIWGNLLESAFFTADTPLFCEKTLRKLVM